MNREMSSPVKLVLYVLLFGLFAFICLFFGIGYYAEKTGKIPPSSAQPLTALSTPDEGAASKKGVLETCSRADAQDVLDKATVMFDFDPTVTPLTYKVKADWWDTLKPSMQQMIQSIADADACHNQTARRLVFEDPRGKHIGLADPVEGVTYTGR